MVDQQALGKLTAEATARLDSTRTVDYCLGEAFRQVKVRQGPFILNLPQDVQQMEMPDSGWTYEPMYRPRTRRPPGGRMSRRRSGCSQPPDARRSCAGSAR